MAIGLPWIHAAWRGSGVGTSGSVDARSEGTFRRSKTIINIAFRFVAHMFCKKPLKVYYSGLNLIKTSKSNY